MALSTQIEADLKTAMKARDSETVAALRLILAGIKNLRVSSGHSGEVSDDEVRRLLTREAKQRQESITSAREAGREDLAAKDETAMAVVRRYLPEELSESELGAIVDAAIAETGASSPQDMGAVMQAVMPKVTGRADGKAVNAMVRQRLA